MLKAIKIFAMVLVTLLIFSGTVSALEAKTADVWVNDDGEKKYYNTRKKTVGEFLQDEDIILKDTDILNVKLNDSLNRERANEIIIDRGFLVEIVIDGRTEHVSVEKGTRAGHLIAKLKRKREMDYSYRGNLDMILRPDQVIRLTTQVTETELVSEVIPYETIIHENSELEKDVVNLLQAGEVGRKEIETEIKYDNGEEVYRTILSESIIQEPVATILERGTKEKPVEKPVEKTVENNSPALGDLAEISEVSYSKALKMKATAYTAGYESTGKRPGDRGYGITASGLHVRHGIVAVDPNVIPLGTELYVEGYGYALAADTGSAIVGNSIDLFYENLRDANRFGRKNLMVYILE